MATAESTLVGSNDDAPSMESDPFAVGLLFVAAISIAQRAFGFFRNVGFCRFLDESDVGQLAMAISFITLASPIFLFGIPGSLTRFVEPYRRSGQLKPLIRRVSGCTFVLSLFFLGILAAYPSQVAWLVFRDECRHDFVYAIVVALAAMVTFNLGSVIMNALRKVRAASTMQFIQSFSFTVLGLAWLFSGGGILGLILIFGIVTFLACLPAVHVLLRHWCNLESVSDEFCTRTLIRRVAPFAVSVWAIDLISNLFDVTDRYMILHLCPGGVSLGQTYVGEYYGSRIIPNLLLSVGLVISSTMMPYMTADWESGRRRRVAMQIKSATTILAVGFTFAGAMCLLAAPWLFGLLFGGRYEFALQILPLAFLVCTWCSLLYVAQDYLWCAEKGRLVGYALMIGLGLNVLFNSLLLPVLGLYGAVLATALANLAALLTLLLFMSSEGYLLDRSDFLIVTVPLSLLLSPWCALLVAAGVLAGHQRTKRTFMKLMVGTASSFPSVMRLSR